MHTPARWLFVTISALALASCVACDDLAMREREVVRASASCSVDADCRVVPADGCHLLCSVAIATTADAAAVASQLSDVREDAHALGCSCPVADCVPTSELSASCIEGVCQIR